MSFLLLWISLLRSYLRVSLGLHPLLSVARMLDPCFQGLLLQGLFHQFRQAELSGTVILSGDATWDALSSSVSCFEPFLVTLFVFCDRAMVSVFVFSSGLSILGNGLGVLSIRSLVFRLSVSLVRSKCLGLIN